MKLTSIPFPGTALKFPSNTNVISWSLHPLPFLNPPYSSATMQLLSSTIYMHQPSVDYAIHFALYATNVRDIPRKSTTLHTLPLNSSFGTGIISLFLLSERTLPYLQHQLKRLYQMSTSTLQQTISAANPSLPRADFFLNYQGLAPPPLSLGTRSSTHFHHLLSHSLPHPDSQSTTII